MFGWFKKRSKAVNENVGEADVPTFIFRIEPDTGSVLVSVLMPTPPENADQEADIIRAIGLGADAITSGKLNAAVVQAIGGAGERNRLRRTATAAISVFLGLANKRQKGKNRPVISPIRAFDLMPRPSRSSN